MTTALAPTPPDAPARPGPLRLGLAVVAVLACLPYLTLKVIWLAGGTIGLRDQHVATDTTMEVANALTAGMELVGAVLAVALVLPIGRRIPAPLLQIPMFVGTGLLAPMLLLVPVQAVLGGGGSADDDALGPIEPWVYTTVYAGFAVLGVCLLTIFVGYAWERWVTPGGWASRIGALRPMTERLRSDALWCATAIVGVSGAWLMLSAREGLFGGSDLVAALSAMAVAGGLGMLCTGWPRRVRASVPMLMVFVGSAVVAAWGAYIAVILAVPNPLIGDDPRPLSLVVVGVLRVVTGVAAVLLLARLAPRSRSGRP